LYAVWLSGRVGFLLRGRMSRRFCPVVQRHGANVDAYAVSDAHVPVYSNVGSMYAQLLRRLHWSPDFVAVVFSYNLAVLLKIRVYRQKLSPFLTSSKQANIRLSTSGTTSFQFPNYIYTFESNRESSEKEE
jgi:hypothetical protein